MSQPGLRILSLDGGGTRCLSLLYILQECMRDLLPDGASPGDIRPCEFFDLIGGSGPSGLAALAFSRFCCTIQEVIDFIHPLSRRFDEVEDFRLRILAGEEEDPDWQETANEFSDILEQIEALRQGIVQDAWSEFIKSKITDVLERSPHNVKGTFDYKRPDAEVEVGRAKAFVVTSESKGYGDDGGTVNSRQYHVPMLHRTYYCRHGKSNYTLYAVGLGTVASPDIMKPGVTFPDFLTTGQHTVHNPIHLLLEEGRKLWPGLQVGTLLSIGTGPFSIPVSLSLSATTTAKACLAIYEQNRLIRDDIRKFILPYDKAFASSCFRLELEDETPFFEYGARDEILDQVRGLWLSPKIDTKRARIVAALGQGHYPSAPEDHLALSSLASILHTLMSAAYTHEAEIVADIITNFILYEGAALKDGSYRKAEIANFMSEASGLLNRLKSQYDRQVLDPEPGHRSQAAILNGLVIWDDQELVDDGPGTLDSPADIAAGAYFVLAATRRGDHAEMQSHRFQDLRIQLSTIVGISTEINQSFRDHMESLLILSSAAALCEAGTVEILRGFKRILFNGAFIRHLYEALTQSSLDGISELVLGPIANALAASIHVDNWSNFRDGAILIILLAFLSNKAPSRNPSVFVNLALEYEKIAHMSARQVREDISKASQDLFSRYEQQFERERPKVAMLSIQNGYFCLLKKCLKGESLRHMASIESDAAPCPSTPEFMETAIDDDGNNLLHLAVKTGFTWITKSIIESLGIARGKAWVNRTNSKGQAAIHLACRHRASKEVFLLLNLCAVDRNLQCNLGRTPLHYCFPNQNQIPRIHDFIVTNIHGLSLPYDFTASTNQEMGVTEEGRISTLAFLDSGSSSASSSPLVLITRFKIVMGKLRCTLLPRRVGVRTWIVFSLAMESRRNACKAFVFRSATGREQPFSTMHS